MVSNSQKSLNCGIFVVNEIVALQGLYNCLGWGGGGVLPEDLGGGVWQASWNPYPISDQNNVIFPTLFQTCLIISSLGQTNVKGNVYTLLLSRIQNCSKFQA